MFKLLAILVFVALALPIRQADAGTATVTVDPSKPVAVVPSTAFGIHTSVYDDHMTAAAVPSLLQAAGVAVLRYPGGGYSDNYHWSIYKDTPWQGTDPPKHGYYAKNDDFGRFVKLVLASHGTALITANYGSNLQGTGPGEPKEAAAWVAYCNATAISARSIGRDGTGHDWKTVGYWASIRAAKPLPVDDGFNFLRIAHPGSLHFDYWEIGNEVFGNGFTYGSGYEEDLHAPYSKNGTDDVKLRKGNLKLADKAYGANLNAFALAMKAVDPKIKIGVALVLPVMDDNWAPDWNRNVLSQCGPNVDFGIVHYYAGDLTPPDWKIIEPASLLAAPQKNIPVAMSILRKLFAEYCGAKAGRMQVFVTETGAHGTVKDALVDGLFAADDYATWIENGAANLDWLELHNGSFLDSANKPGPPYFGIEMANRAMSPGDTIVDASSDTALLTVHAVRHKDGTVTVMLINKDPANALTVHLNVDGLGELTTVRRVDFGRADVDSGPRSEPPSVFHGGIIIDVPAYSIADLVVAK